MTSAAAASRSRTSAHDRDRAFPPIATCVVARAIGIDLGEDDARAFGGESFDDAAPDARRRRR